MKTIVFTGGGTAGHVMPILALLDSLESENISLHYIGSKNGIERELVFQKGIQYYPVSTGKLRRYFDLENFVDPFRIIKGVFEARKFLKRIKPDLIFSKGGFVSVPTVLAGFMLKIPILLHESDYSPGLANKLTLRFADKILVTFPETLNYLPQDKAVLVGTPIRKELLAGDIAKGKEITNFNGKPVLMVIGGSIGSQTINEVVRSSLKTLLDKFNVIHLCGQGNLDHTLEGLKGYQQFEFVKEELSDLFAITDLVVSRAGANTLYELLSLRIPNILIPLSLGASRGDQLLNSKSFKESGFSIILYEEDLSANTLVKKINELYESRNKYIDTMTKTKLQDSNKLVLEMMMEYL